MQKLAISLLFTALSPLASADYLQCNNGKDTDIGFYNNWGKISYQLSVPRAGEFLYEIGNCWSLNEGGIGIPYSCEAAAGSSSFVEVSLIRDANEVPTAQLNMHLEDGSISKTFIPCEHFD